MKKLMKKGRLPAFLMVLAVCIITFAAPVAAHAEVNVNDAFDDSGTMFSQTENVVRKTGGSLKSLITTIAVIVLVISVIFVGLQFTSKNAARRQEAKSNLASIIIGAILVFASIAVITLAGTISEALETSVEGTGSGQNQTTAAPDPTSGKN